MLGFQAILRCSWISETQIKNILTHIFSSIGVWAIILSSPIKKLQISWSELNTNLNICHVAAKAHGNHWSPTWISQQLNHFLICLEQTNYFPTISWWACFYLAHIKSRNHWKNPKRGPECNESLPAVDRD